MKQLQFRNKYDVEQLNMKTGIKYRIFSQDSRNQDYARVLRNMKSEIEKLKNDETRNNYTDINGIIILLMVQGQALNDNQKNDIRTISEEITDEFSGEFFPPH